jgi:lipid-binding SYLF domain-containing protein
MLFRQGAAAGSSSLVKMSIGYQLGGQAFSEIIFFQDKRACDEFTRGVLVDKPRSAAIL